MDYVKVRNTKKQPKTNKERFSFKTLKILLYWKERKRQ